MTEPAPRRENKRVLIIGGYGVFGGRLARLLVDEPRLTLIIAGRSAARARTFCKQLNGRAQIMPKAFDRSGNIEAQLHGLDLDVIVDASGPFQDYGTDAYRVVRAALALGADYLDLADSAEFVTGIDRFDDEASNRNITILSGVSSYPVLTAAVVRHLAHDLETVEAITAGIAPSPYADVGQNVIRALLSYAGKPIELVRQGKLSRGHGIIETMRYTIAPPGRLPLKNRLFCLVDVPDLKLLPANWPDLKSTWIGAGPAPEVLLRTLNWLAQVVRLRLLPTLTFAAPLAHRAAEILKWGEHRGGMFVEVKGSRDGGTPATRSWHMLAEGDDGPFIPAMAAAALLLKSLNGEKPAPGARSAINDLELADYHKLFADRAICDGIRDDDQNTNAQQPLYQSILGDAWYDLPDEIRAMHTVRHHLVAIGTADVDRGGGPLVALAGWLFGFPRPGRNVPLKVEFTFDGHKETWTRNFGSQKFRSIQQPGKGRSEHLIEEVFGPISVGLAVVVTPGRLSLIVRRWSLLGIPLPMFLAPSGETFESVEDGVFRFNVEIRAPIIGLLATYRGHLVPQPAENKHGTIG